MPEEIDNLFQKALGLNEADRKAFLASLPDEQRTEVEDLLAADAALGDFMELESTVIHKIKVDEAPKKIGPYKVLQPIGKGGMGQVFMAEQTEPVRRRVALKIIKTETPSKEILARFEAERQALAMMDHQNIAKVLDAGITESGLPYFAMELVKGVPITEYCDKNKLTPNERLELFVQTCRAIQHAHMKGIVHRDIKPSNVLVTLYDGKPVAKVIDFGLAKALQDTIQLTNRTLFTQFGQVVGTLAYMSPEQAEMNALDVDTRTDVYSLGVVLYELLTGSTPITREKIKSEAFDRILALIREEEAIRPSQRLSESGEKITGISDQRKTEPKRLSLILKGDLDWIAVKALEKDRTRRYDTPASLGDDVERYLNSETIDARPPSFGYMLEKSFRKHRGKFIVGTSIFCMLIAGLFGTGTMWYRASKSEAAERIAREDAEEQRDEAEIARRHTETQRDRAKAAEQSALNEKERAEEIFSRANLHLASIRLSENRVPESIGCLEQIPPRLRNLPWKIARRKCAGTEDVLYGHESDIISVAASPDGKLAASLTTDCVRVWDLVTEDTVREIPVQSIRPSDEVYFSPVEGRVLLVGDSITVFDIHDATAMNSVPLGYGGRGCDQSRDRKLLAISNSSGEVEIWHTGKLEKVSEFTLDAAKVAIDSRGDQIAVVNGSKEVSVMDVNSGKIVQAFPTRLIRNPEAIAFSADGRTLCIGCLGYFQMWDIETGEMLQQVPCGQAYVIDMECAPDNEQVACACTDGMIRVYSLLKDNMILNEHFLNVPFVTCVAFDINASRLLSGSRDAALRIWDLKRLDQSRLIHGFKNGFGVETAAWSADSKFIATMSRDDGSGSRDDGAVRVWDAHTLENIQEFQLSGSHPSDICFHESSVWAVSKSDENDSIEVSNLTEGNSWREAINSPVVSVSFAECGRHVLVATESTVRVFTTDGTLHHSIASQPKWRINGATLSPDGMIVAVEESLTEFIESSFRKEGKLRFIRTDDGEEVTAVIPNRLGSGFKVRPVAFSAGRELVAFGDGAFIRIYDLSSGAEIRVFERPATDLAFLDDGNYLVSANNALSDNVVRLWDMDSAEELPPLLKNGWAVYSLVVNPKGTQLAVPSSSGFLQVYPIPTDYVPRERQLAIHNAPVIRLEKLPDDNQIRSFDTSGRWNIWDVRSGAVLKTGVETPASHLNSPMRGLTGSDGTWLAIPDSNRVRIITLRKPASEKHRLHTERLPQSGSSWHLERANRGVLEKNWHAATFHFAKCMHTPSIPKNADVPAQLKLAFDQLKKLGFDDSVFPVDVQNTLDGLRVTSE